MGYGNSNFFFLSSLILCGYIFLSFLAQFIFLSYSFSSGVYCLCNTLIFLFFVPTIAVQSSIPKHLQNYIFSIMQYWSFVHCCKCLSYVLSSNDIHERKKNKRGRGKGEGVRNAELKRLVEQIFRYLLLFFPLISKEGAITNGVFKVFVYFFLASMPALF
jgi:hypothetical protein